MNQEKNDNTEVPSYAHLNDSIFWFLSGRVELNMAEGKDYTIISLCKVFFMGKNNIKFQEGLEGRRATGNPLQGHKPEM